MPNLTKTIPYSIVITLAEANGLLDKHKGLLTFFANNHPRVETCGESCGTFCEMRKYPYVECRLFESKIVPFGSRLPECHDLFDGYLLLEEL